MLRSAPSRQQDTCGAAPGRLLTVIDGPAGGAIGEARLPPEIAAVEIDRVSEDGSWGSVSARRRDKIIWDALLSPRSCCHWHILVLIWLGCQVASPRTSEAAAATARNPGPSIADLLVVYQAGSGRQKSTRGGVRSRTALGQHLFGQTDRPPTDS